MGETYGLRALGDVAFYYDNLKKARVLFNGSLELFRKIEARLGEANALTSLARLTLIETQSLAASDPLFEQARRLRHRMEDAVGEGYDFLGMAIALATLGNHSETDEFLAKAKLKFELTNEKRSLETLQFLKDGIGKIGDAIELSRANRKIEAKEIIFSAKIAFLRVGDFLLYKYVDRIISELEK